MLADLPLWADGTGEQVGEVAFRELRSEIGAVACLLEQVRVGVEGHARAGVAEHAADLDDVEADVDDQMAGEGMAQIVEAHPPVWPIESRTCGGAAQHAFGDVVVQKRGAAAGREHVIGAACEAGASFVLAENRCELGEERYLTDGGACLGWDAVRRHAAAATRELVANVNDGGGEVDVVPAQPEHLGESHARVRPCDEQRPISPRTGREKSAEFCLGAGGANGVPLLLSPPVAEGVVIRPERDADHPVIAEVVRAAFVGRPDEVASFVERNRASELFIPELALVAEDSSGVVAHVMLSWVGVEGGSRTRILNLTPMSVRPDRQRVGVGSRLIRDALGRAEEAGEPAVMVEGVAAYYPRFGFERASALGFISPHPKIPDEAFMVKRLPGYGPDLAGRIVYPAAFDALGY